MKVACFVYYVFLGVLRYLNKACAFFICAKNILKKKIITINCPDNLNIYTTVRKTIEHS